MGCFYCLNEGEKAVGFECVLRSVLVALLLLQSSPLPDYPFPACGGLPARLAGEIVIPSDLVKK